MLVASLTLSVLEFIILLLGAMILGITIHAFIANKESFSASDAEMRKSNLQDEWKIRYFNDMEMRDREIEKIKDKLQEAEENVNIYLIEVEEMHRQKRKLEMEIAGMQKVVAVAPAEKIKPQGDYLEQLRQAQNNLMQHHQKIDQLLQNIDLLKQKEEMQKQLRRSNEELSAQIGIIRAQLAEKEKAKDHIRQKDKWTHEMKSMLDNAHHEFDMLQDKIHKLETQLSSSILTHLEYEDMKEAYAKINRDVEQYKLKVNALAIENQQLQTQLAKVEDKLQETDFQRQQLQKRSAYLEQINSDLQIVSDTNKKLEGQLRRVGELESMLNMMSEEKS